MGSQPGGAHHTPTIDWIAVLIMLVGTIGLGLALPFKSWWVALAGGVVLLVGAGIALAYGIMNNTEDYEVRPKDEPSDPVRPAGPPAKRIISA